jgi:hypothetical protein
MLGPKRERCFRRRCFHGGFANRTRETRSIAKLSATHAIVDEDVSFLHRIATLFREFARMGDLAGDRYRCGILGALAGVYGCSHRSAFRSSLALLVSR